MTSPFSIVPIGTVRSPIREAKDDVWGQLVVQIELDAARFSPDSLVGLDAFSHVEVLFLFDRVDESAIHLGARHPRGRTDWPKVGIFAQRAKMRPNRIGVTICRLLSVDGLTLAVDGLDAIDGTPVIDLKPYMREFAPKGEVHQPAWVTELMAAYWTPDKP